MANELDNTLNTDPTTTTTATPPAADPVKNDSSGTSKGLDDKGGDKLSDKELEKLYEANLLKKLGVDSFDTLKTNLSKFGELTEAQKTAEQKQIERLAELETSSSTMKDENVMLNAKLETFKLGVESEYIDDVIVLAKALVNDDTDISQAIQKVVDKYPTFKSSSKEKSKPTFATKTNTKHESTDMEQVSNILLGKK
jgi:hypothetical protein